MSDGDAPPVTINRGVILNKVPRRDTARTTVKNMREPSNELQCPSRNIPAYLGICRSYLRANNVEALP